jgi:hypothetical protein
MDILTKPVGEKDRRLIVHPKPAVEREAIRRNQNTGRLEITNPDLIKIKPGTYYPEVKEAGHRCLYCRDKDGQYHVYGRKLNVKLTYTDIYPKLLKSHLAQITIPKESVLDLELVWPGHPDSEVATAIKECPEKLIPKIFAAPIWEGDELFGEKSLSYVAGRQILFDAIENQSFLTRRAHPVMVGGPAFSANNLASLLNTAEKFNIEGWVLKGASCDQWWKLKGAKELDAFITGFKISDAETRKGLVTALYIGLYYGDKVVELGSCAGLNLELMEKITANQKKYLNRVIRVQYQEVAGKGKLKHGFFDCFRDDKNKESCTVEQLK